MPRDYSVKDDPWTDPQKVEQLKELHAEKMQDGIRFKYTFTDIAVIMKLSKNAVIAKAHRLGLKRGSPIKRTHSREPDAPPVPKIVPIRYYGSQSLPPLASTAITLVAKAPAKVTVFKYTPRECCWLDDKPEGRGFIQCTAVAVQGKSYCAEHCKVAYIRRGAPQEVEASAF